MSAKARGQHCVPASMVFYFIFETRSLKPKHTDELDWLASRPQGHSYLCLPGAGITGAYHHTWLFICVLGNPNSGSCAYPADILTELSISMAPNCDFKKVIF